MLADDFLANEMWVSGRHRVLNAKKVEEPSTDITIIIQPFMDLDLYRVLSDRGGRFSLIAILWSCREICSWSSGRNFARDLGLKLTFFFPHFCCRF
jgi:hypothetical protein